MDYRFPLLARRSIEVVWFVSLVAGCILILTSRLTLVPNDLSVAVRSTLMSTIVQGLAALAGIAFVLLFITAQLMSGSRYTHTRVGLYSSARGLLTLVTFGAGVGLGVAAILQMRDSAGTSTSRLESLALFVSGLSVIRLVVIFMMQLENMNPLAVAWRLAADLDYRTTSRHGLILTTRVGDGRVRYRLQPTPLYHGVADPLRPLHEIVMQACNDRDRVFFRQLMRILLFRVERVRRHAWSPLREGNVLVRFRRTNREQALEHRIEVELFVLHYVVRRCRALAREWSDVGFRDAVRQACVADLCEVATAVIVHPDDCQLVEPLLYGILHLCLGYRDVPRAGPDRSLGALPSIAARLLAQGNAEQAQLTIEILAALSVYTDQYPADRIAGSGLVMPDRLTEVWADARRRCETQTGWLPGEASDDLWRYMSSVHSVPDQPAGSKSRFGARFAWVQRMSGRAAGKRP
jgi:hypothetical protein